MQLGQGIDQILQFRISNSSIELWPETCPGRLFLFQSLSLVSAHRLPPLIFSFPSQCRYEEYHYLENPVSEPNSSVLSCPISLTPSVVSLCMSFFINKAEANILKSWNSEIHFTQRLKRANRTSSILKEYLSILRYFPSRKQAIVNALRTETLSPRSSHPVRPTRAQQSEKARKESSNTSANRSLTNELAQP